MIRYRPERNIPRVAIKKAKKKAWELCIHEVQNEVVDFNNIGL